MSSFPIKTLLFDAQTAYDRREFDQAIEKAEQVLQQDGANFHAYEILTFSHYEKGDLNKAEQIASKALAINSPQETGKIHAVLSKILLIQEPLKAESIAKRALEIQHLNVKARHDLLENLAQIYILQGNFTELDKIIKRGLTLFSNSQCWYMFACTHLESIPDYPGCIEMARTGLTKETKFKPYKEKLYIQLLTALCKQGALQEAEDELEEATQFITSPDMLVGLLEIKRWFYLRVGKAAEMEECIHDQIALTGKTPKLCVNLVCAQVKQGKFQEALKSANEGIFLVKKGDPLIWEFYYWRAVVHNNLRNYEAAIKDAKLGLKSNPTPEAKGNLEKVILYATGRRSEK